MTLRLPCRSWLKSHRREAEQPMRQPAAKLHSRENYLEISTQSGLDGLDNGGGLGNAIFGQHSIGS